MIGSESFKQLVRFLVANGYKQSGIWSEHGQACWVSRSRGVRVELFQNTDGEVFVNADNLKVFNKGSQSPLICKSPQTDEQRLRLLEHLKFLGTQEAEKWSAEFGFMDDNKGMPRSIEETL